MPVINVDFDDDTTWRTQMIAWSKGRPDTSGPAITSAVASGGTLQFVLPGGGKYPGHPYYSPQLLARGGVNAGSGLASASFLQGDATSSFPVNGRFDMLDFRVVQPNPWSRWDAITTTARVDMIEPGAPYVFLKFGGAPNSVTYDITAQSVGPGVDQSQYFLPWVPENTHYRIRRDGGNFVFSHSADGVAYAQITTLPAWTRDGNIRFTLDVERANTIGTDETLADWEVDLPFGVDYLRLTYEPTSQVAPVVTGTGRWNVARNDIAGAYASGRAHFG